MMLCLALQGKKNHDTISCPIGTFLGGIMSITNILPQTGLFLGEIDGQWARELRETLHMDLELFWDAVGVIAVDGSRYETCRTFLPRVVVTAMVYVHLYKLPPVFFERTEPAHANRILNALEQGRRYLTDDVRARFLACHFVPAP